MPHRVLIAIVGLALFTNVAGSDQTIVPSQGYRLLTVQVGGGDVSIWTEGQNIGSIPEGLGCGVPSSMIGAPSCVFDRVLVTKVRNSTDKWLEIGSVRACYSRNCRPSSTAATVYRKDDCKPYYLSPHSTESWKLVQETYYYAGRSRLPDTASSYVSWKTLSQAPTDRTGMKSCW